MITETALGTEIDYIGLAVTCEGKFRARKDGLKLLRDGGTGYWICYFSTTQQQLRRALAFLSQNINIARISIQWPKYSTPSWLRMSRTRKRLSLSTFGY